MASGFVRAMFVEDVTVRARPSRNTLVQQIHGQRRLHHLVNGRDLLIIRHGVDDAHFPRESSQDKISIKNGNIDIIMRSIKQLQV